MLAYPGAICATLCLGCGSERKQTAPSAKAAPLTRFNRSGLRASVTTIEGLAAAAGKGKGLHPVQKAWIEAQAPQCCYCQSGQIMQAAALLTERPNPSSGPTAKALIDTLKGRTGS
jgi:xanthine dehydrogenase iron-sulfur cluster and FAD-binding subunit A